LYILVIKKMVDDMGDIKGGT